MLLDLSGRKTCEDTNRSYHENEKDQIDRERRKRRRKKGKLPLKGRDSILERLRKYQEIIRRAGLP